MNKQTMRAFAFGLLAASLALFLYNGWGTSTSLSDKTMIKKLEEKHYTVLSADEAEQQKLEKENLQQDLHRLTSQKNKTSGKETKKEATAKKGSYKLRIEPGMSSSEAGRLLEKAGIIQDSETFNTYLTENGYAAKLQIGEHTLHPSMTMKEIAVVLTTK
ncbi:hypothetical protein QYG89_01475 [Bacillus sp. B190/17]|uniref:Endolytic transglycosylase MltG n=1 Tax=Bacillus lumedeiriae TaxID=3058829 RepID=A0ABW8I4K7_9BACI